MPQLKESNLADDKPYLADRKDLYAGLKNMAETKEALVPEADKVFDRVYRQLAMNAQRHSWSRSQPLEYIAPLHGDRRTDWNVPHNDIFDKQRAGIYAHLKEKYKGRSERFTKAWQEADRLFSTMRATVVEKVRSREIDPVLAKMFLLHGSGANYADPYNDIVRQPIDYNVLRSKQDGYSKAFKAICAVHSNEHIVEQDSGLFWHFNSELPGKTESRIYISADLSKDPAGVLQSFQRALEVTGLNDEIYFKIPTLLSARQESIIIYVQDTNTSEQIINLITAFNQYCPNELLSESGVITANELCRGVSFAPEPRYYNALLSYEGRDTLSYNHLISVCMTLAFETARIKADEQNITNLTPGLLREEAKKYFRQALIMAGINPDTMVTNSLGGQLPEWAKQFKGSSQSA